MKWGEMTKLSDCKPGPHLLPILPRRTSSAVSFRLMLLGEGCKGQDKARLDHIWQQNQIYYLLIMI